MPYKDPEARRAYDRARAKTPARRRAFKQSAAVRTFVGVDGEGGILRTGERQEYLMLRAGEEYIHTGKPLTPTECLTFLADLDPDRIYVAYSFGYDVAMICRNLPWHKVMQLVRRSQRMNPETGRAFMVDIRWIEGNSRQPGDIQIDWIPEKEFSVRKWTGKEWTKTIVIHDVWTFFQQSFVATCREWVPDSAYADLIDRMEKTKGERDNFGPMTEHEIAYNLDECSMMALVMSRFRSTLEECGIPFPAKWQGPGNIASSVFNKHGIPKRATRSEPVPGKHLTIATDYPGVVVSANNAYYGGRFEPIQIGHIRSVIYQYDMNSAYAAMYGKLPCLLHGHWERSMSLDSEWAFAHIVYVAPKDTNPVLGPFPCRTRTGTIIYPLNGEGWYTGQEIRAANDTGYTITVLDAWNYVKRCDCQPFDFVADLYRQRKAAGKSNRGRIFKLALASMYGKLAQSVGEPVYSNPVWASFITGYVRAQLYTAAMSVNNGRDVVMLATDGIFTRAEMPDLPLGPALGEWDLKQHDGILAIQSGVYLAGNEKPKTRGVPMRLLREQDQTLYWNWLRYVFNMGEDPDLWRTHQLPTHPLPIRIKRRVFTGLKMAVHLDRPEIAGTWDDVDRLVNYQWETKRESGPLVDGVRLTEAPFTYGRPSYYYSKDIGKMSGNAAMAELRMMEGEQPDWNI